MNRILTILFLLLPFITKGQTYPPQKQGAKLYEFMNGTKHDSALFLPVRDTAITDPTMKAPGMLLYRSVDSLLYYMKGNTMTPIASGNADLSNYYTKSQSDARYFQGTIVQSVSELALHSPLQGDSMILVKDSLRGGIFYWSPGGVPDNILIFSGSIGFWYRSFNPAAGIHIDWAGADPTGGIDASAAIKSVFALPYKKFVFGAGSRYRLDDSIRIANKDSLTVDFNGATIYENTVYVRTIVFHGCNALTIRNANFDGAQTYASFQANTPTIFRSYLRVDSCENAVIEGIRSKNKQGALSIGKAYKVYINNIDHIGFMDNTHKANANYCPAIQVEHDGYDVVTRWNGYTRINNVHSRDGGSALLMGDDAQYYTISNIQGENLYDNGIYVSSAFYAAINGCIFRNAGSTGIKVRGRGFTITGNVITNSQVGIVVTGNSDQADPFFGPPVNEFGSTGYGTVVSANVIDSVSAKGISIELMEPSYTCNDVTVNGNVIMHHTGTTNQYALQVSTVAAATVMGNKIYSSTGTSAVFINNKTGDSTQHNVIANNIIHGCTGIGVTFSGVKKSIIEGNRFFDVTGNAMLFQNCSGNQVINNYADGLIYNASAANSNTRNVFMFNRGSSSTTDNANNAVLWNLPNIQQGVANRPWFTGSTTVSSNIPYIAMDTVSSSNWSRISLFWQLNGLSGAAQALATGTSGTDINWNSTGTTHTLNVPTASATNRGALSSADWSTFNNKAAATGGTGYIQNQSVAAQANSSFWTSGIGRTDSTFTVSTSIIDGVVIKQKLTNDFSLTFTGASNNLYGRLGDLGSSNNMELASFARSLALTSVNTQPIQMRVNSTLVQNIDDTLVTFNTLVAGVTPVQSNQLTTKIYVDTVVAKVQNQVNTIIPYIITVAGSSALTTLNHTVIVNNAAPVTITLPTAASVYNSSTGVGRIYVVKKISGASLNVTVKGNGSENIDGVNTKVLTLQYSSIILQSDGTQWHVIGGYAAATIF